MKGREQYPYDLRSAAAATYFLYLTDIMTGTVFSAGYTGVDTLHLTGGSTAGSVLRGIIPALLLFVIVQLGSRCRRWQGMLLQRMVSFLGILCFIRLCIHILFLSYSIMLFVW